MISHAKSLEAGGILPTGVLESLASRVRKLIEDKNRINRNLPGITCAASLAYHKVRLGYVETLFLSDVDLSTVPDEHLTSLVSGVAVQVNILNVSDRDLVTILDSVKSEWLLISNSYRNQSLGCEETRVLVRAMESRVESVAICRGVTVDIGELIEYNGLGKCKYVEDGYRDSAQREQLRTWATSKNWKFNDDVKNNFCTIHRPL